jgi:NADPH-dependent 2,4-dienoyl-CoA reductase/sulfur reductase-like enzyme
MHVDSSHGGEGLRKIIIVAAGVLALAVAAALALAGVVPDGAHAWHSIQVALNSAVDTVKTHGAHAWH